MPDECQKWSMEMIMFKSKPITLGSAIFNRQVSDKRRACDESSYRLHECSGSAPRDVSARALHPQLRPGGIAGPLGEDARLADQWVCVLPRSAFERRPRPRRNRAETLRAGRVGGGAVLLRARARAHFNEQELIALMFTLTTINAWNRLAITMRTEVGKYQPKA